MLQKLRKDHCDATKIISGHEETNKLRAYSTKKKKETLFLIICPVRSRPKHFPKFNNNSTIKKENESKKKKKMENRRANIYKYPELT